MKTQRYHKDSGSRPDRLRNCACGRFMSLDFEDGGHAWALQEWNCKRCDRRDVVEWDPRPPMDSFDEEDALTYEGDR